MSNTTYNTYSHEKQAQIVNQLMDLFQSNQRGYGVGEFKGAIFKEDKNKWIPGGVRWEWGAVTEEHWRAHLSGERLLGLGPIMDNGQCWYATLDVDKIGTSAGYEFDYAEEMSKIKQSKLPLVVFRTKSGGLRVALFFTSPIEAELVVPRMNRLSALLGYAGCEIFPKQTKLDVANGDCPSWIYLPFGGTGNIFAEQGVMNELGNLLDLDEAVALIIRVRITKDQFFDLFASEDTAKKMAKSNGKRHSKGTWVEEDSWRATIDAMFHDGPPCLWTLTRDKVGNMQNNFLLNVATLLKRKYDDNWKQALSWVNVNVLQPVGNAEKLTDMIKRFEHQEYEYTCQQEPICSHCNSHACRRMTYGVGTGNVNDMFELGIVIINTEPQRFFINIGEHRVLMDAGDLLNQRKYMELCLSYGTQVPRQRKNDDWINLINKNIEGAPRIEPTIAMKTNASEIETLTTWFSINVPSLVHSLGQEYLDGGGRLDEHGHEYGDESVRVRISEQKFYFKWQKLAQICRRWNINEDKLRRFVETKCEYHKQGPGVRGWFRNTYSIGFDKFDEEAVNRWLELSPSEELH